MQGDSKQTSLFRFNSGQLQAHLIAFYVDWHPIKLIMITCSLFESIILLLNVHWKSEYQY